MNIVLRSPLRIAALQPADIDAFAKKYFVPKNRVSITLAGKGGAQ